MSLPPTTLGGLLTPTSASGRFEVERGTGWRGLLAAGFGFPPTGSVPVVIDVARSTAGCTGPLVDVWVRRLGGHTVRTTARLVDGQLHETLGPLTIAHTITIGDGLTTTLESRRWWLRLGRWGLPLPDRLRPRILVTTRPVAADPDLRSLALDVAVRVADRRDQLVVAYRGRLRAGEVGR